MVNSFAIEMLVDGKTDTELLEALVAALTDGEGDECLNRITGDWDKYSNPEKRSETVIVAGAIISSICEVVRVRFETDGGVPAEDTNE